MNVSVASNEIGSVKKKKKLKANESPGSDLHR